MAIPFSICSQCGLRLGEVTPLEDLTTYQPVPGDIAVCLHCAAVLMFDVDLHVGEVEAAALPTAVRDVVEQVQSAVRQSHQGEIGH